MTGLRRTMVNTLWAARLAYGSVTYSGFFSVAMFPRDVPARFGGASSG